jgi:hypothetical protein
MNLTSTQLLNTIVKATTELPGLNYTDVRTALIAYRDYFRALLDDEEPPAFDLSHRADTLLDSFETTLNDYPEASGLGPDFEAYHQAFKQALRDVNSYNGNRRAYLPELGERLRTSRPKTAPAVNSENMAGAEKVAPTESSAKAEPTNTQAKEPTPAKKSRQKAVAAKSQAKQASNQLEKVRPKPAAEATSPTQDVYLLRVSLVKSEPEVWRRLMVTTDTTLNELHRLLQLLMNLNDEHLHRFKVGYDFFGPDSPDGSMDSRELYNGKTLHDIYAAGYKKFFYTYDFAANREHRLTIQQVLPYEDGIDYPLCTNGAHVAPPDNSITTPKYNHLIVALADKHHADHELAGELLGRDWEVDYFSASEVNEVFQRRFLVAG